MTPSAAGIAAMVEEYKQAFFEERLQMFAENGIDLTREENVPEVNPGTGLRRYYTQCQTHKSKAIPGNVANKDRYHLAVVCSK
jgi:S-methylmethionine-dependent homocysteine/selenocysteine methylase